MMCEGIEGPGTKAQEHCCGVRTMGGSVEYIRNFRRDLIRGYKGIAYTKTMPKTGSCRRDWCKRSGSQHQTRPPETSEGNVDSIAVLEPDFALPAPVDDLLPKVKDSCRWLLGAHQV